MLVLVIVARTRGRLAGIAGSLAPGITRRVVYDQTIRNLRRQLVAERVVADVRLHHIRPGGPGQPDEVVAVDADPDRPFDH